MVVSAYVLILFMQLAEWWAQIKPILIFLPLLSVFIATHWSIDLPAMDDDDQTWPPYLSYYYGEAQAILAGDALQTLAFDLIANHQFAVSATQQVKLIASLSKTSGIEGMVGGQALDIEATDKEITVARLERIHKLKQPCLIVLLHLVH